MGLQGLHPFYIYGSHTEDAVECASLEDAASRFAEMLAAARRRGCALNETEEHRWEVAPKTGKTYAIWIADKDNYIVFFKE